MIDERSQRHTRTFPPRQAASPMQAAGRTLALIGFTLKEYLISGRIWIEGGLTIAFFVLFLRGGEAGIEAEKFFLLTGLFCMILTIYTVSSVVGMGDRPQGYLVLARNVGRADYLLGHYVSGVVVVMAMYLLLSLATTLLSRFADLSPLSWLLGTLPLLLNVALLGALMLILSPLVMATGWRLLVLGLIALAFSGSFLGNHTLETMPGFLRGILTSLQTILGWPMVPAFSGFALMLSRNYSGNASIILISQSSLMVALLSLALYAFSRREVVLRAE